MGRRAAAVVAVVICLAAATVGCSSGGASRTAGPSPAGQVGSATKAGTSRSTTATSATTTTTTTTAPTTLPPITPAVPGQAVVIGSGPTTAPGVALTFDDGYCDECVGGMVQMVARTKAHVTFCPNGRYSSVWNKYAGYIKALIAQGLVQICNHTFNHLTLTGLSDAQIRSEIQSNEDWIEQTFGVTSRPFLRPPGGTYNSRVLAIAGQLGFTRVLYWSATLSDSSFQPPQQVIGAVDRCGHPGMIVLGHVNYTTTEQHFTDLIDILNARNLRTFTVKELVGDGPGVPPDPRGACV